MTSFKQASNAQRGFSLLEVLIAVIVLSVGLLGMALLQSTNLRFTQSANHRTVATNLAYEGMDLIRANKRLRNLYAHTNFEAGEAGDGGICEAVEEFDHTRNLNRWRCQVSLALPNGESRIAVAGDDVTISIRWDDARWEQDEDGEGGQVTFAVESTL